MHELLKLVKSVQYNLSNYGALNFPKISIYTADNDPTADTKGSEMVLDALGSDIVDIQRYASNRHVIIEPQSKQDWDADQVHYDRITNDLSFDKK